MLVERVLRVLSVVVWAIALLNEGVRPAAAQFENGTKWDTYEVCYKIDSTAAGFTTDIDQAAADWTSASDHGFEFYKDNDCENVVYEGYIDGVNGWVGYTLIDTDNGQDGCWPNLGTCTDPTP